MIETIYCVTRISTGINVYAGPSVGEASLHLIPGTVWAQGLSTEIAQERAKLRAEQARTIPGGWELPPNLRARIDKVLGSGERKPEPRKEDSDGQDGVDRVGEGDVDQPDSVSAGGDSQS